MPDLPELPTAVCPKCNKEWQLPLDWELRSHVAVKMAQKGKKFYHVCANCKGNEGLVKEGAK